MTDFQAEPARPRSKAVTTLAAVNLILGGLRLVLSVLAIWLLITLLNEGPGTNADLLKIIGFIGLVIFWPVLLIFAMASMLLGILLIIAGMGLRRRRSSSRTLTLVLGTLGGVLAAVYGNNLVNEITDGLPSFAGAASSLLGMILHGSYCIFVFVVLLNRRNAAEFK